MKSSSTILLIAVLMLMAFGLSCRQKVKYLSCRPADFNMVFRYGVDGKNILNTFDSTYTRDMIRDPSISTKLALTALEMDSVYRIMENIKFENYPDTFSPSPSEISPMHSYYYLEVKIGPQIKKLYWEKVQLSETNEAKRLKSLINYICNAIYSKPEYKTLPRPKGLYL